MTSLILSIAAIAADDTWHDVRVGKSGLVLSLPVAPEIATTREEIHLTGKYKSVVVSVVAAEKSADQTQPLSAAHSEKQKALRELYGRKITATMNEQPVEEAATFGADESIGFVVEVNDGPGRAVAWQRVLADGWEYDINVTCDRRDQPVLERILGSARYVDPATGDFRITALGATGLQSYLGIAFLPKENVARSEATSVVLDSGQFPAMVLATLWQNPEVDYENEAQLRKAMTKWLSAFVQGAESRLEFKAEKGEGETHFDISGTVVIQGIEIKLLGVAYGHRDDAQAVIAVIDPRQEGAEAFARKILASVSKLPAKG
ncbi:MAG: hypothetical protein JNM28_00665 [Armatimonadetes bacterium]|nr:hypothetical protein [Armatimonadota bacterium]